MLLLCNVIQAVPAYTGLLVHRQSTGKGVSYYLKGDEYISWQTTTDGYTLLFDNKGDLVYAVIDKNGNLVPSDMEAADPEYRNTQETEFLAHIEKNLFFSEKQMESVYAKKREVAQDIYKSGQSFKDNEKKDMHLLVVLVDFPSQKMNEANIEQLKHQIQDENYTQNGRTGSVRDYFYDNSCGQVNPIFDVYGPITLPKAQSYYAESGNTNAWRMVPEALTILDSMGVDFAKYDNDGDGYLDLVHVIYAGVGSHYGGGSNAIWAHMSHVRSEAYDFDGKKPRMYACSSEIDNHNRCDGIGPVCHEMGHAFGLPDMYDADYSESGGESVTTNVWDVMSHGPYNNNSLTPPYHSVVERALLGWMVPDTLSDGEYTLKPLCSTNTGYYSQLSDNEYATFELRNKNKWDAYLPGQGMLVYHSQASKMEVWRTTNEVNTNPKDRGHYLEFASGNAVNSDAVPFPGSKKVTYKEFFKLVNGDTVHKSFSDVRYEDTNIVFNFVSSQGAEFSSSVKEVTSNSAVVEGVFTIQEGKTVSKRQIAYKKQSESKYTYADIESDTFSVNLENLTANTIYEYRLVAVVEDVTYNSFIQTFKTVCDNPLVNSYPYEEGFENGLGCWTVEGEEYEWEVAGAVPYKGYNLATPHGGKTYAIFSPKGTTEVQTSRLVSPVFDLSKLKGARLRYYFKEFSSQSPALKVEYRLSADDEWKTIQESESDTSRGIYTMSWSRVLVTLPEMSSQCQISFVGYESDGMGIVLDDIAMEEYTASLNGEDAEALKCFISPNPVNDNAVLHINGLNSDANVIVCDVSGKIVAQYDLKAGVRTLNINSASFASGVYSVKVMADNTVYTEKLIKL